MQTLDTNNNILSSAFNSAITGSAQVVKPRVLIDLIDSRYLSNVSVSTNSDHSSSVNGSLGYFFNKNQVVNGFEYETFSWAVTDSKDNFGQTITANGQYRCLPSDLADDLNYGWMSGTASNSSGLWTTNPYVSITFDATIINKIKVVTSKTMGQVKSFLLEAKTSSNYTVYSKTITFDVDNFEFEKTVNIQSSDVYSNITNIVLTVVSTKNVSDYARILSVSPLYTVDITDYVIDSSSERIRDLHETTLPIAGTAQNSSTLSLDNSSKIFSLFNQNSKYGKFLKKNLKLSLSYGWRSYESNSATVVSFITSNIASTGTNDIIINNASEFPASSNYLVKVDPGGQSEELFVISGKVSDTTLSVSSRAYGGSSSVAHTVGDTIFFDPFEYVDIGTYYVDEISTSSSMLVDLSLSDQFNFLNDKILTKGYFNQTLTVGEALEDLVLLGNFPKHKISKLNQFHRGVNTNSALLHLKFNDESNNNVNGYPDDGLRLRVYQPSVDFQSTITDMQLDRSLINLSELDKALGLSTDIALDYVGVENGVYLNSFVASNAVSATPAGWGFSNSKFYQGIFDGYFIPTTYPTSVSTFTGLEIGIQVDEGGARLYIDDNLVIDAWNEVTSSTYYSNVYDFTGGTPYKISLEFYHTGNVDDFTLILSYGPNKTFLESPNLITSVVKDSLGARDANFTGSQANHHNNDAVPTVNVLFNNKTNVLQDRVDDAYVSISPNLLSNNINSYIRLPYHHSWNPTRAESYPSLNFSIEYIFKAPNGGFGGGGEYISNLNSALTLGLEFFYIGTNNHGVIVKTLNITTLGTVTLTSSTSMTNPTGWNHVILTYDAALSKLYYYVGGVLHASATLSSTQRPNWTTTDMTFGGRGASFISGTGPVLPTSSSSATGLSLYMDEFVIYKKYLSAADAKKRYIESQIQELTIFPFLYGESSTIYQIMIDISFADLGRFYLDEKNNFVYEHMYALFEPSIDSHYVVQKTISDLTHIINSETTKTVQTNSVVVKIAGIGSLNAGPQPIWRAPSPTTLGVITLLSNIVANSSSIEAGSFDSVPFNKSGYICIDTEIIKYSNLSPSTSSFVSLTRGALDTVAASHSLGSKVREVRHFDFDFDKTPSVNIQSPFITGIIFEEPDEINILHWSSSPFKGNLIITASTTVDANTFIFAEGDNVVTGIPAYTSIAGTSINVNTNDSQIVEQKSVNSENRRRYGLKEITIDSKYIYTSDHAQKLASFMINKLSEETSIINLETIIIPTLQIGDRIKISTLDQLDINNKEYWVISISTGVGSGFSQNIVLRSIV